MSGDVLDGRGPHINYMEGFVNACLAERDLSGLDPDLIVDIKCIALNGCPAWYVRDVEKAAAYMPRERLLELIELVNSAIDRAIEKVSGEVEHRSPQLGEVGEHQRV